MIFLIQIFLAVQLSLAAQPENKIPSIPAQPCRDGFYGASASDELQMWGKLDASRNAKQGLIVCLPMMGRDYNSFTPLLKQWRSALAGSKDSLPQRWLRIDLRGHGGSVVRGKDTLNYRTMPDKEFLKYPSDVLAFLHGGLGCKTDSSYMCIVGASIGANTAVMVADSMSCYSRLVLLSPGKSYHGLEPAEAIKKFKGQMLLVATKGDTYSYEAVQYFHDLNPDHSTVLVYDGDAHATDILDSNPKAMKDVVDWLLKK